MKIPNWVIVGLAPLMMAGLAYLFLLPHNPAYPVLENPVIVLVLDPTPEGMAEQLIDEKELPGMQEMLSRGVRCDLVARQARVPVQAWLETITGKDVSRIRFAGVTVDPRTYAVHSVSFQPPENAAALWRIAQWNHKPAKSVFQLAQFRKLQLEKYDLVVAHFPRTEQDVGAYLAACDRVISGLLQKTPPPDALIVVSPMVVPRVYNVIFLNQWLAAEGYLVRDADGNTDWANTRAFCVNSRESGIRIHSRSVYSLGIVPPDRYTHLQRELKKKCLKFRDPESGRPLFSKVYSGPGKYRHRRPFEYPDVDFVPDSRNVPLYIDCNTAPSDSMDGFVRRVNRPTYPCYTENGGWMLLYGKPFFRHRRISSVMASDVTPTVLYLMDIPTGRDMQGRVMVTALRESWLRHPRRFIPSHDRWNERVRQPDS